MKSSHCANCGMLTGHPAEYHPWVACALKKAGYTNAQIKANIHAILDHGRRLERQRLSNDALLSEVKFDSEEVA